MPQRPDVERWLASHGLEPKFETILLSSIDEDRSRNNQVRLIEGAVSEDRVNVYAQALAEGSEFPPILARPYGRGYVIVDGNHRYFAHKKNAIDKIEAYIIDPEPEKLEEVSAEVNTRNGYGLTDEERILHGIHLVKIGMDYKSAAKAAGITTGRLTTAYSIDKADKRARELKAKGWDQVGSWAKLRLGQISTNVAFLAAVKAVAKARPKQDEINKFVTALNKMRSEAGQLAHIDKMEKAWLASKNGTNGRNSSTITDKAKLMAALSLISKVDIVDVTGSVLVDERTKVAEGCRLAAERLRDYANRLDAQYAHSS